jgi:putative tryptophan/tyrosine transport system substrate-binding protein
VTTEVKVGSDRPSRSWIWIGLVALLMGLGACGGGDKKEEKAAAPTAPGQEAAITGTIALDPSVTERVPKEPLLMILASKSPDPNKPAIIVKRVPGVTFPYRYTLTAEDITLVGSTFDGKLYVTARIDPAGMVGAAKPGTLQGTYSHNPVVAGSTNVDIVITSTVAGAGRAPAVPPGSKVPRIGLLWSGSTPFDPWSVPEGLRQGFRELGYVEGQGMTFEPRYAEALYDRLPDLAAELVRLKVDVILAAGDSAAVQAAQNATKTIPIVMMAFADTVQLGLVASLARPGGNVTGLSFPFAALVGKQLELLKTSIPGVSRVAVLWNPANPGHGPALKEIHVAARSLEVQLQLLEVRGPGDFEVVFSAMNKERASAVLVLWDPMLYAHTGRLMRLALSSRLPAISTFREFVEAGGLMAYGPNLRDMFRGGASYVDKILKGARPADLPVEQPTRFELVINLTTAKALGLTIPQSVLIRADEVIQ